MMANRSIYPLLLFCILIAYPFLPQALDQGAMIVLLAVVVIGLVSFYFRPEPVANLRKQYLKHSILFIIGYVIVHFQYPLDYVLGNVTENNLFIWMNTSIVVQSLFYSTIGLISFLWGYTLYQATNKEVIVRLVSASSPVATDLLHWLAAALLGLYFLTVNPLYLAGHYGSESMGATATYLILLFKVVIFAILIQNCRNMLLQRVRPSTFWEYVKAQGFFLPILILVYLLSVMISGDRGPIITFSIAYVAGFFLVSKKKLSFSKMVVLVLAAAFFITILGIARSLDKDLSFWERVNESIGYTEEGETSVLPQTRELAGSVRTLHAVVDYVPDSHPHTWGRFQVQQLISSIPFSSVLLRILPESGYYRFKSPASFATWVIQGDTPSSGAGTTCLADLYVEFGLMGIIIGMLLLGYSIRFAEVSFYAPGFPALFPLIFALVYLSDAIYISRSSILFGFRTVVWIYIILLLNKHILNRR